MFHICCFFYLRIVMLLLISVCLPVVIEYTHVVKSPCVNSIGLRVLLHNNHGKNYEKKNLRHPI